MKTEFTTLFPILTILSIFLATTATGPSTLVLACLAAAVVILFRVMSGSVAAWQPRGLVPAYSQHRSRAATVPQTHLYADNHGLK